MNKAESALSFIDATDRTVWVQVGFALKDAHGDMAFDMWDRWSSTASNYDAEVAKSQWRTFKAGKGISISTLFFYAKQNGWVDDEKYSRPTPEQLQERRKQAASRLLEQQSELGKLQAKSAQKAKWILSNTVLEKHAYLSSHGMKDDLGLVWYPNPETNLLVIPMRVGKEIVGVQLIDRDGNKKFLRDQRCDMAEFVIGNGKTDIWCEGYCTGVAIRKAVAALKMDCAIHVCFSAQNMKRMAKTGYVVADNDISQTGERIAKEIGLSYYLPEQAGWDFCDLYIAKGLFFSSQLLRRALK